MKKRCCFYDALHPENMYTGVDLQIRLDDDRQAYQLCLYAQVAAVKISVWVYTEMFYLTLPPVHTPQVLQL